MAAIEGAIHAREIDTDGSVRPVDLAACTAPCTGWRLIALGAASLTARDWLREHSGLSENARRALLEDDTRPRCTAMEGGALLILRGAAPGEDNGTLAMVSLRLFITPDRVLTVQRRRYPPFENRVAALDDGMDAAGPGHFVAGLVAALRDAMEPVLDAVETGIDDAEIEALGDDAPANQIARQRLNVTRRAALLLRRYLTPQAEAVRVLAGLAVPWLDDAVLREELKEAAEQFRRAHEDLDALHARAVIVADESALRVAEETNQRLLTLSVVSLLFLPLTFLTGLLGVNLAGIPFAEAEWSFGAFAITTIALGLIAAWLLRRRDLL